MELKILRELPGNLWSAVVMEPFERLAYYGRFVAAPAETAGD